MDELDKSKTDSLQDDKALTALPTPPLPPITDTTPVPATTITHIEPPLNDREMNVTTLSQISNTPIEHTATNIRIAPLPPLQKPPSPTKSVAHTPDDLAKSISSKLQSQASSLGMSAERAKSISPLQRPQKKDGLVQQVRTFKSDVAHIVEHQNITAVDIVAAEENRKADQKPVEHKTKSISISSIALVLGILIFLLGGGGALGYVLLTQERSSPVSVKKTTPSLVFAEKTIAAVVKSDSRNGIQSALIKVRDSIDPTLGTIEQIKLVRGNELMPTLTTDDFLTTLEARTSSAFTRSLKPDMMIGIHSADELVPFFVFKTDSYEQAYAGMLAWEANIADDLSPFLTRKTISRSESFTDTVIHNKDARILRDTKGNIAYVYSFPDRETLIITTREATLTEIARRLSNTRVIKN